MPPYDSESSGDEDNDYALTNVLLGYAAKEAKDDVISQLGGRPVCPIPACEIFVCLQNTDLLCT